MKHFTLKLWMVKQKIRNKIQSLLLNNNGIDDWFALALKIVIVFVIGALVIALMIWLFGDSAIGGWMKNSTNSWFPTGGESRPSV